MCKSCSSPACSMPHIHPHVCQLSEILAKEASIEKKKCWSAITNDSSLFHPQRKETKGNWDTRKNICEYVRLYFSQ